VSPVAAGVRQEDDVVASRRIVLVTAAAVVVALAAVFAASVLLERDLGSLRAGAPTGASARAAGRRIANVEQTPILAARDGLDLRDLQRRELSRARWLDRDAGVAAIPIERAMDLVAGEEGAEGR